LAENYSYSTTKVYDALRKKALEVDYKDASVEIFDVGEMIRKAYISEESN